MARDGDRATPFGAVLNELGDRAAELAVLAGCLALAPAALVLAAALAATLPSWVALAGAAAGLGRIQGGPVGKTERCLLLALLAAIGWPIVLLGVLAVGSALTAAVRLARLARLAAAWRRRPRRPACPGAQGAGRRGRRGAHGERAGRHAAMMAGVLTLGGIGALVSRNADVIRKWRTWMVSAPLVAGCLWLGAPGAVLLAAGLGVTGAVEYGRLARLRPGDSALIAAAAVILPLVAWRMPAELGRALAGVLLAAALVPVIGGDAVAGARRAAAAVFGVGLARGR